MKLIKDMNGDIVNIEFIKNIIFSEEDITINYQDGDSDDYEINKHSEAKERINFENFKQKLCSLLEE